MSWVKSTALSLLFVGCGPAIDPDAKTPEAADASSGDAQVADGGAADASFAPTDSGLSDGGGPDSAPPGVALYPSGRRHSPLTPDLVSALREVSGRGPSLDADRFIKVGDSITVSRAFLHCFAGAGVDLGGRTTLEPTLGRFAGAAALGTTPFDRESTAATVGWSASAALAGAPSPLDTEHSLLSPRFAVIMFGSNDVGFRGVQAYARDIWTITDRMLDRGTIPLLSTFPPRDDSAAVDASVPLFNLAVRAIAQGRGVPLVDLHHELLPLPSHGLGGDGVHPNVAPGGGCQLTPTGLEHGYNVRNLLTLEQLDRAARALDGEALDESAPRLRGAGTAEQPYLITGYPFAMMADTRTSATRALHRYACSAADESGPEVVYRLEIERAGRLTAAALSPAGVDVDVHLLRSELLESACTARDDQLVRADVTPGTWYLVMDTFVGSSGPRPGEFLVAVDLQ